MGQASWFIAALIIAELIFLIGIWISKGKNMPLAIMGVLGFGLSIYLSSKIKLILAIRQCPTSITLPLYRISLPSI